MTFPAAQNPLRRSIDCANKSLQSSGMNMPALPDLDTWIGRRDHALLGDRGSPSACALSELTRSDELLSDIDVQVGAMSTVIRLTTI
jgi:hypothetical protein